jgi:hypothetical protein
MQVPCPAEQRSAAAAPSRAHALMSVRGLGIRFRTSQGVCKRRAESALTSRCANASESSAKAVAAIPSPGFRSCGCCRPISPVWMARSWSMASILPRVTPRQCAMYASALAILVVSLAFNAVGESLRIVLDPTIKDR